MARRVLGLICHLLILEDPHSLPPPSFLVPVSPIPGLGGPEDFCLKTLKSFILPLTSSF